MRRALLLTVPILLMTACLPAGPVFRNISSINVRHLSSNGLNSKELAGAALQKAISCLNTTVEVTVDQTQEELLATTYLVVVTDSKGDRNFELYTARNMKGNKGKYYENRCIHKIVGAM